MGKNIRLGIVSVEPFRGLLVSLQRFLGVAKLSLVYFSKVLLLCSCAAQVSLQNVMADGAGQDSGSILRVGFAVHLKCFLESIGGIIGLAEVLGLN